MLAVAGMAGSGSVLHMTLPRLAPILGLSLAAGIAIFAVAPWVALLFGPEFQDIIGNLRMLCLYPTLIALQIAAYDALGGADQHRIRAFVYNTGTLIGVGLVAALTYTNGVMGLITGLYVSEVFTTGALWLTLSRLAVMEHRP
jgi:O-antigen/teichoic acid export membrane protein